MDHRCLGKFNIHYVEVLSEEDEQQEGNDVDGSNEEENEDQPPRERKKEGTQGQRPILASLSSDPVGHPFV